MDSAPVTPQRPTNPVPPNAPKKVDGSSNDLLTSEEVSRVLFSS